MPSRSPAGSSCSGRCRYEGALRARRCALGRTGMHPRTTSQGRKEPVPWSPRWRRRIVRNSRRAPPSLSAGEHAALHRAGPRRPDEQRAQAIQAEAIARPAPGRVALGDGPQRGQRDRWRRRWQRAWPGRHRRGRRPRRDRRHDDRWPRRPLRDRIFLAETFACNALAVRRQRGPSCGAAGFTAVPGRRDHRRLPSLQRIEGLEARRRLQRVPSLRQARAGGKGKNDEGQGKAHRSSSGRAWRSSR
jgi:hypothetical protein